MRLKMWSAMAVAVTCGLAVSAQEAQLNGPVAGWTYDAALHAIRPVVGIPGAAYLGAPLASNLDMASVSPDSSKALALLGGDLYVIDLERGQPIWRLLAEDAPIPDSIAWSGDSNSAALFSSEAAALQLWRNLDGEAVAANLALAAGKLTAMAVENSGTAVLAAFSSGDAGAIYRLEAGQAPRALAATGQVSALAFGPAGELIVADRGRQEIFVMDNARDGAAVLFANASRGIQDPVGLAVSPDGVLLVASGSGRKLSSFRWNGGETLGDLELDFEPQGLRAFGGRLPGAALYVLNDRYAPHDALQLLQRAGENAVYFVPAADAAAAGSKEE